MLKRLLFLSLLACLCTSEAATLGIGNTTCMQYASDSRTKRNFVDTRIGAKYYTWSQGFITAMNHALDEDVGKTKSPDRILDWLVDYCEVNRLDNYSTANQAFYDMMLTE